MDGSQVSFGRRGLSTKQVSPAAPGFSHAHDAAGHHAAAAEVAPNMVVERNISKMLMYVGAIWIIIFLTAGSSKHSNALPYWMRPDADFHLQNYLVPAAFCAVVTLLTLGPAIRRPIALKLYDDHFEFVPLLGAPRIVRWADVGDISPCYWDKYKTVRVEISGEKRLRISTSHLTRSRDEIASLLEYSRSHAGFRGLHLSGEPIDSKYMFPGH